MTIRSFTQNLNFSHALSFADLIPINKIDEGKISKTELAILKDDIFAAAEEGGTQMGIGVQTAFFLLAGMGESKFNMIRTRVMVLPLGSAGRDQFFHEFDQVNLEEFAPKIIQVMGAFLQHDRTGGVVGKDGNQAILDTGFSHHFLNIRGNVVKAGHMIMGLKLDFV
jgi:hypothetical protein